MFEARQSPTGSWVIYKDGVRFGETFYLSEHQADRTAEDMERAFMAGCDHGEQVRHIQEVVAENICPHCLTFPLTPNGICSVCSEMKVSA